MIPLGERCRACGAAVRAPSPRPVIEGAPCGPLRERAKFRGAAGAGGGTMLGVGARGAATRGAIGGGAACRGAIFGAATRGATIGGAVCRGAMFGGAACGAAGAPRVGGPPWELRPLGSAPAFVASAHTTTAAMAEKRRLNCNM